jgi:(4S)-4-hydroxy-5-phosphonooxypentane-2,3-dione isomerase
MAGGEIDDSPGVDAVVADIVSASVSSASAEWAFSSARVTPGAVPASSAARVEGGSLSRRSPTFEDTRTTALTRDPPAWRRPTCLQCARAGSDKNKSGAFSAPEQERIEAANRTHLRLIRELLAVAPPSPFIYDDRHKRALPQEGTRMAKLVVIATAEVEAALRDKLISSLKAHGARRLKDEPGTLQFEVLKPQDDDRKVLLHEVYDDAEAFEVHRKGASITRFREEIAGIEVTLNVIKCAVVE